MGAGGCGPSEASTAALSSGLMHLTGPCSMRHSLGTTVAVPTVPHSGEGTEMLLLLRHGFLHTLQTPEMSRSVFVLERYMIPLRITNVPILQWT